MAHTRDVYMHVASFFVIQTHHPHPTDSSPKSACLARWISAVGDEARRRNGR